MARYPLNLPDELKREAREVADRQGVSLNQFVLWAVAEKVGALRQAIDDPDFPQVTYRRGASGWPTPVLRGTGLRVKTLYVAQRNWGMSVAEIAEQYGLDESRVKAALAFAQAHLDEIQAAVEADEAVVSAHVEAHG